MSAQRFSRSALGVSLLALAVIVSGCVSSGSESEGANTASMSGSLVRGGDEGECTAEKAGGAVTIAEQVETATMDPAGGTFNFTPAVQIYSTLMRWNPATSTHDPLLAESLTSNSDGTEWTLTLPADATFGDGSRLDAAAVIASMERHRKEGSKSQWSTRARAISSLVATDDQTVVFTLQAPWNEFPYLLGTGFGMITNPAVDPSLLVSNPPANAGAGAFVLDHWTPGVELMLNKKADWWKGEVCLDSVRIITIPESKTRKDAFDKGEVQVYQGIADIEVSQEMIDGGANFSKYPIRAGFTPNFGFGSNADTTPTKNRDVRLALQLGLDEQLMRDRTSGGVGESGNTLVSADAGIADGLEGISFDPEQATKLVEKAKADGWDGVLNVMALNQPNNIAIANQAIAQWRNVGIDARLQPVEIAGYLEATQLGGGGFDILVSGGGMQPLPECTSCDLDYYVTGSSYNRVAYSNPEIDRLAPLMDAADAEGRKALLTEYQAVWNEDIPRVLYGHGFYIVAWSDSLQGVMPARFLQLDLSRAWLEK